MRHWFVTMERDPSLGIIETRTERALSSDPYNLLAIRFERPGYTTYLDNCGFVHKVKKGDDGESTLSDDIIGEIRETYPVGSNPYQDGLIHLSGEEVGQMAGLLKQIDIYSIPINYPSIMKSTSTTDILVFGDRDLFLDASKYEWDSVARFDSLPELVEPERDYVIRKESNSLKLFSQGLFLELSKKKSEGSMDFALLRSANPKVVHVDSTALKTMALSARERAGRIRLAVDDGRLYAAYTYGDVCVSSKIGECEMQPMIMELVSPDAGEVLRNIPFEITTVTIGCWFIRFSWTINGVPVSYYTPYKEAGKE